MANEDGTEDLYGCFYRFQLPLRHAQEISGRTDLLLPDREVCVGVLQIGCCLRVSAAHGSVGTILEGSVVDVVRPSSITLRERLDSVRSLFCRGSSVDGSEWPLL